MEETKKPIRRVLMLADFACATGFAQVAQNVVLQLLKDQDYQYQIDIVAINYHGTPNEWFNVYPTVRLLPAALISNGDLFGRNGYLNMLSSGAYDLSWVLQDTFNIEQIGDRIKEIRTDLITNGKKVFKLIFYFPIDAQPKENWINKSVSLADVPVVYTHYGYEECIKHDPSLVGRLKVIPHGTDINVFKPMDKETVKDFRHKYFMGLADDKFLVTNINRNQPRKDIARTMQAFRLFKNQAPEALLYLHMKNMDVAYTLDEVARNFKLIPNEDYIVPKDFDENQGVIPEVVNLIYNSSDCLLTTTLGEGWGLSITEAMATKTPVIAPNNTAITEILADGRGLLVENGKTISEWIVLSNDNERIRPLVHIPDLVDKLMWLRNNKDSQEVNDMVEKAYNQVTQNWTWDQVGEQWRQVFKNALTEQKVVNIGRNDPCYCGSGKKYKHCHGG